MSTQASLSRHSLTHIVVARAQDACVAWVNGQEIGPSIDLLFGALSKLQEYDDRHANDGPSAPEDEA